MESYVDFPVDAPDVQEFCQRVACGELYESIMPLVRSPASARSHRTWVKRRLLADVLGSKRPYPSPVRTAFQGLYPTVWKFIQHVNRHDHGELLRRLQRVESEFILHTVGAKLSPMPVVALHDGYFAPSGLIQEVLAAVRCMQEKVGFDCQVEVVNEIA